MLRPAWYGGATKKSGATIKRISRDPKTKSGGGVGRTSTASDLKPRPSRPQAFRAPHSLKLFCLLTAPLGPGIDTRAGGPNKQIHDSSKGSSWQVWRRGFKNVQCIIPPGYLMMLELR